MKMITVKTRISTSKPHTNERIGDFLIAASTLEKKEKDSPRYFHKLLLFILTSLFLFLPVLQDWAKCLFITLMAYARLASTLQSFRYFLADNKAETERSKAMIDLYLDIKLVSVLRPLSSRALSSAHAEGL
jgi:hypothetical protein